MNMSNKIGRAKRRPNSPVRVSRHFQWNPGLVCLFQSHPEGMSDGSRGLSESASDTPGNNEK